MASIRAKGLQYASMRKQRGQAIVLVLLVSIVTILVGLSVGNNAILVSEKMQLQNAADAAAYSVSTIEARDLNFTAYTNRAMVANEVAMGQILGLLSWAVMFRTIGPTLTFYFQPILTALSAGTLGILTFLQTAINALLSVLTTVGSTLEKAVNAIAKVASKAIVIINMVYSTAQRAFHFVTLIFSAFAVNEMLKQNADNASISGFGFIALAGHFVTYFNDLSISGNSFVTSYAQDKKAALIPHFRSFAKPGTDDQKAGVERLASIINESRDRFSTNRWNPWTNSAGWSLPLFRIPRISFCICPKIPLIGRIKILEADINLSLDLNRRGGSDLRYKSATGSQQHYSWSAVDTTSMDMRIRFMLKLFGVGPDINETIGVPVGVGASQAALTTGKLGSLVPVPVKNMRPSTRYNGQVEDHAYGGSPGTTPTTWGLPWVIPWPRAVQGPSMTVAQYNTNTNYRLPRYNDTKPGPDAIKLGDKVFGFEAPYLIIGLTKNASDVASSTSKGRFALPGEHADGELAVMAKSEVYFSRPSTLSYFARSDGKVEYGSGFNPYWQARLVDTTYLDRVTALGMQQKQLWLPNLPFGPILDDFKNLLDMIS